MHTVSVRYCFGNKNSCFQSIVLIFHKHVTEVFCKLLQKKDLKKLLYRPEKWPIYKKK